MVHFLKQLVDSIYRPAYWYQLILHWAVNCLPAGTVACVCVCGAWEGMKWWWGSSQAALMTNAWGRYFSPQYKLIESFRRMFIFCMWRKTMCLSANPQIPGTRTFLLCSYLFPNPIMRIINSNLASVIFLDVFFRADSKRRVAFLLSSWSNYWWLNRHGDVMCSQYEWENNYPKICIKDN